jgi:hypothetical protein
MPQILAIVATNTQILPIGIVGKNQVVQNIIVEIIDSGFEHFIICKYVYDIQLLGKCFLNTSIDESCQAGW